MIGKRMRRSSIVSLKSKEDILGKMRIGTIAMRICSWMRTATYGNLRKTILMLLLIGLIGLMMNGEIEVGIK